MYMKRYIFFIMMLAGLISSAAMSAASISTLKLTNQAGTYTDKAYVSFNADKEDVYTIGHDLQKMQVSSPTVQQLWLEAYDMQLSAYEVPLGEQSMIIPIGMYAPSAGNYTLSISGVPADIFVYLMKNGQPVADIAQSAYVAALMQGNNSGYGLFVWRMHDIVMPTETRTLCQGEVLLWQGRNIPTNQPGTFELRDTLTSSIFPYPDSIHVLDLTVYAKPTIVLSDIASECYPADVINVAYTSTDAATLSYELQKDATTVIAATDIAASTSGTIALNTTALAPGVYTLRVKATSANECESEEVTKAFTIYPKPIISISPIENKFLGDASMTVAYTTADATMVSYYIDGVTTASALQPASSALTVDISALPAGTYTLCMIAYTSYCQSEVAMQSFTIYQMAEVSDEQSATTLGLGEASMVVVNPAGELLVPAPVHIHSLELQYTEQAHAQVTGIQNLTADEAAVILNLPEPFGTQSEHWYAFGVPFEVSVATGIYKNGQSAPATIGTDFAIEEFDGQQRATTQQGWKRLTADAVLQPGHMYMISMPAFTAWRFVASDPSALSEQAQISVGGYPSAIGNHHAGWNAITNTLYTSATGAGCNLIYATTYNNYFGVYMPQLLDGLLLEPATPFFVQVAGDGLIDFSASNPSSVAARMLTTESAAVSTITLAADARFADKAYVSFNAMKDDAYSIGHDLQKIRSASAIVPQVWTEAYGKQLSAYSMPQDLQAVTLPIGMYAPAKGTYTLAITDVPADISVSLMHNGLPVSTLSENSCALTLNAGNNGGYALYVQRSPRVVTNLPDAYQTTGVQKTIVNGKLFIICDGKIYDAAGMQVQPIK